MTIRDFLIATLTAIIVSTGFLLFGGDDIQDTHTKTYEPLAINKRAPKKKETTTQLYNPKKGVELVDLKPTLEAAQDALSGDDGCALRAEEVERVQVALQECDERFDKTQDELEFLRDDFELHTGVIQEMPEEYPTEFQKEALESRFKKALKDSDFTITGLDCDEFPCLVIGTLPKYSHSPFTEDFFSEHFADAGWTNAGNLGRDKEGNWVIKVHAFPRGLEEMGINRYEIGKRILARAVQIGQAYNTGIK